MFLQVKKMVLNGNQLIKAFNQKQKYSGSDEEIGQPSKHKINEGINQIPVITIILSCAFVTPAAYEIPDDQCDNDHHVSIRFDRS
jgi:heme-binding NEAT domain protein